MPVYQEDTGYIEIDSGLIYGSKCAVAVHTRLLDVTIFHFFLGRHCLSACIGCCLCLHAVTKCNLFFWGGAVGLTLHGRVSFRFFLWKVHS